MKIIRLLISSLLFLEAIMFAILPIGLVGLGGLTPIDILFTIFIVSIFIYSAISIPKKSFYQLTIYIIGMIFNLFLVYTSFDQSDLFGLFLSLLFTVGFMVLIYLAYLSGKNKNES